VYFNNSLSTLIQINNNTYSFNNTSPTTTIYYSDLPTFTSSYGLEQNSIENNPNFLFNSPDSFAIGGNSAALNMGGTYNSALEGALDYAGNPRLAAASPDAGAYEFVGFPTAISEMQMNTLCVYPNPAHDHLFLSLDTKHIEKIYCIDILGRCTVLSLKQNAVDLRSLSEGTYVIKVFMQDGRTYSTHVIKN
jgi:hypothetical protein